VMARVATPPPRRRWSGTLAASLGVMVLSGGALWRVLYPQPLVSIESPPVQVTLRPNATTVAETYLLTPPQSADPFVILFQDEIPVN